MLIILSITITIFFAIALGTSYAWYAYNNASSGINGKSIEAAPTVIFKETDRILLSENMPIYDEDRYTYANKFSFNITIGDNLKGYDVALEILLDDIAMSNELKIANYKYELMQDGITIQNGDFSLLGDNRNLKIMPRTIYNPDVYPKNYTFDLYIWLSEDESNQNELMNKVFMAKVAVNSAAKKKLI